MDPLVILLIVVAVLAVAIAIAVVLFLKEKREIESAASERADQLIAKGLGEEKEPASESDALEADYPHAA